MIVLETPVEEPPATRVFAENGRMRIETPEGGRDLTPEEAEWFAAFCYPDDLR